MKRKENSRIRALVNPIVFSELFNQPFYSADFLNSTEYFDVKEEDIEIKNTKEFDGVNAKISDMDVVLKIMDKDKFEYLNLEMQNRKPNYDMMGRLMIYLSRLISKSESPGLGYQNNKATVLAIFNFTLFDDNNYVRVFQMKDEKNNIIQNYSIIIFELTKREYCDKKRLRDWLDIFVENNLDKYQEGGSDIMKKVAGEIVRLNADEEVMFRIISQEVEEKFRITERENDRRDARAEGLAEGRAKGLAEGRAEGLAEGRAEGLAKGRTEGKLDTAKKLKELNVDIDIIIQSTGLSKEEVEKL